MHCLSIIKILKLIIFNFKTDLRISTTGKQTGMIRTINLERRQYIPHYYSDKGFRKGTVVNRALQFCLPSL